MQMKTFFLSSQFEEIFQEKTVKVPTGQTRKNFFGFTVEETRQETQTVSAGRTDGDVDGQRLSEELQRLLDEGAQAGFRLVSITPIVSGKWVAEKDPIRGGGGVLTNGGGRIDELRGGASVSYGYSYTEGLLVVMAKEA